MPIIEIKNIGKKYNISHQRGGYLTLRDVLVNIFKNPFNFLKQRAKAVIGVTKNEEFWALDNISFNVEKGEVIGIIGRNGAGKSTLLKILSQITPPTEGEIKINGRVGSLLEVGTGFHPELTGRENIFLNGAILGMERAQIIKKFDEIVEFSGVQKFLDTPVKYYSSGMYVRLAFSVAAHMEPDVLIIDEVLAVGDAEFQKKCLGKMDDITRKEGRTILFVSHNMAAIQSLCKKCVFLQNGHVKSIGDTQSVIREYLEDGLKNIRVIKREDNGFSVKDVLFKNHGNITDSIKTFDEVEIEIVGEASQRFENVSFAICFNNEYNVRVTSVWTDYIGLNSSINPGSFKAIFKIPSIGLIPGIYDVIVYVESEGRMIERIDDFKKISVYYTSEFGLVKEPIASQGLYIEKFNFLIK